MTARHSGSYVLLTRPQVQSEEMTDLVHAYGFEPLIAPMLEIETLENSNFSEQPHDALIYTSVNAVHACPPQSEDAQKPVFCVGEKTRTLLEQKGFLKIHAVPSVKNLISLLRSVPESTYLYRRGEDVRSDLQHALSGKTIYEHVCYRARQVHDIPDFVFEKMENGQVAYAVFMSVRTGQAFVNALSRDGRTSLVQKTKALCLSDEVLESISVLPWLEMHVAAQPNVDHLLAILK